MRFFKAVLFIFLVALFFAALTAGVNQALIKRIKLNEQTRNTRYLLDVLGIAYPAAADPSLIADLERKRTSKLKVGNQTVYRAYDEAGKPDGYAFRFEGKGFWGRISGLLSLKEDLDTVKGIIFTSHNETPGLGARIDEPWFRKQFQGIKLSNAAEGGKYVSVGGDAGKANRVDAITGATMTSSLLEKLLNRDLTKIAALKDKLRSLQWPSPQAK